MGEKPIETRRRSRRKKKREKKKKAAARDAKTKRINCQKEKRNGKGREGAVRKSYCGIWFPRS